MELKGSQPMEFRYGAGRTRAIKFVVTCGATHANCAGHPESVSAFRHSVAVALVTCEGSTVPLSGSA